MQMDQESLGSVQLGVFFRLSGTLKGHLVKGRPDDEQWRMTRPRRRDQLILDARVQLVKDGDWILSLQLHPVVKITVSAGVASLGNRFRLRHFVPAQNLRRKESEKVNITNPLPAFCLLYTTYLDCFLRARQFCLFLGFSLSRKRSGPNRADHCESRVVGWTCLRGALAEEN